MSDDLDAYLVAQSTLIERHLNTLMGERRGLHAGLFDAARYATLGGGKRLRPILTLATSEAFGVPDDVAIQPACAVELVHTYSLIHDDLPCMDNDDFRRGKPSVHKAFPEAVAVLTGDYLLTYAFEVLATAPSLQPHQRLTLVSTLAKASGSEGLIGGQLLDIEAETKKPDENMLQEIHRRKTGALIAAAVQFGGIVADVPDTVMKSLSASGLLLGLAFQIIDDILDVTHGEAKHGKKGGSDAAKGKTTFVTLLGMNKAHAAAEKAVNRAISVLRSLPCDAERLEAIAGRILDRQT